MVPLGEAAVTVSEAIAIGVAAFALGLGLMAGAWLLVLSRRVSYLGELLEELGHQRNNARAVHEEHEPDGP